MKYLYCTKSYYSETQPICNLCNSSLLFKHIKQYTNQEAKTRIIKCNNVECDTNKPNAKRTTLYSAFLPSHIVLEYIAWEKKKMGNIRPNSVQTWLNKGYSVDEAKKIVSEIQKANSNKVKNRFIPTRDNLIAMGKSDEDVDRILSPPSTVLHWTCLGFSHEDAIKKVSEFQSKMADKFKKKKQANPNLYTDYNPTQLKYWLKLGYSEEDAKKLLKERQTTFSLDLCILKYGPEEGLRIFNERQSKWIKKLHENFDKTGDGRSKQSKWASFIIQSLCDTLNIDKPHKEKWINGGVGSIRCSYDFTHNNRIIEFNGDYWHANPLRYSESDIIRNGLKAYEIWAYDNDKVKLAESKGYSVLVVWESEWKLNREAVLNKCLTFLTS